MHWIKLVESHQVRHSTRGDVEVWRQRGSVVRNRRQVTMMQYVTMESVLDLSISAVDMYSIRY